MPHKDPEARRAYQKAYGKKHLQRRVAGNKRRRLANPERVRIYARKKYADNREEICAYNRQYYADNRERILAREQALYVLNGEHIRAYNRAYNQAHPQYMIRGKIIRRLRHNATFVEHVDKKILYKRDKHLCSLCHGFVKRQEASIDHIIPLARGGEHSYKNTALAHLSCNIRKHARIVVQQMRLF